eukprot:TRINITY_DN899_c0_g1_i16.p1 TRINITY_DN899_c0_g1~~TRINITY_DN899_c0_g1_i16.p1  ORF type:complete len:178 (+),score=1.31 TRINITY_DN899_c0_g1_i16:506-1039(+)
MLVVSVSFEHPANSGRTRQAVIDGCVLKDAEATLGDEIGRRGKEDEVQRTIRVLENALDASSSSTNTKSGILSRAKVKAEGRLFPFSFSRRTGTKFGYRSIIASELLANLGTIAKLREHSDLSVPDSDCLDLLREDLDILVDLAVSTVLAAFSIRRCHGLRRKVLKIFGKLSSTFQT